MSVPATIDNTFGAVLLGGFVTAILYGITCLQCFIFFQTYTKEDRLLKYNIWLLWILDTLHMVFVIHPIYWYLVTNFSNPAVMGLLPWSIVGVELTASTSDTIVRAWFTYRVYMLSANNRYLTIPLACIVFTIGVLDLVMGIRGAFFNTFAEFRSISWNFYLVLALDVVADFYIATSLCFFLYRLRNTVNKHTLSVVKNLMMYTVNTGLATSVVLLACFITYACLPDTLIFIALYFPSTKLYVNALLASLNARDWLAKEPEPSTVATPLADLSNSFGGFSSGFDIPRPQNWTSDDECMSAPTHIRREDDSEKTAWSTK